MFHTNFNSFNPDFNLNDSATSSEDDGLSALVFKDTHEFSYEDDSSDEDNLIGVDLQAFDDDGKWESYNSNNNKMVCVEINNEAKPYLSYTHYFFEELKLNNYLNNDHAHILHLGASIGRFLAPFQSNGWDAIGYDCSTAAVYKMQTKNLTARCVNFNLIDSYKQSLANDLTGPSNVIAIRLLQYLKPEAVISLIYNLLTIAKPGTVFFLGGSIFDKHSQKQDGTTRTSGYIASFFAPRTDINFLLFSQTKPIENVSNQLDDNFKHDVDEILVVQKWR